YLECIDDWAGGVTASCCICSVYEDPDAFHKAVKHRWVQRRRELPGKEKRMRSITFENLDELFRTKMPGASSAKRRQLMVTFLKATAMTWYSDMTRTKESEVAAQAIQKELDEQIHAQAKNPFQVTQHTGWSISARDASYLIFVCQNVIVSFICRKCGYYGADWIQSSNSYHFRCVNCGEFYRPWSGRNFNKIIVLQDPTTGQLTKMPAMWPATAEDNWLMAHAEMYARQVHLPGNLAAFLAKQTVDLTVLLRNAGTPDYFEKHAFGAAEWLCAPPKFGPETYRKFKEQGFMGNFFTTTADVKDEDVFRDWDTLIALLGNLLAGGKAMAEKMKA
ncbi:MAG: hypothetical protein GY772_20970, partial [bacterium]|nr:hypothetical protein [bacterium]